MTSSYLLQMLSYSIRLCNAAEKQGQLSVTLGENIQTVKLRILAKEKLNNSLQFKLQCQQTHVTSSLEKLVIVEQMQLRSSTSSNRSRKMSGESNQFEESSNMSQREQSEYLQQVQPEKPPVVKGTVKQSWKFFSCLSTTKYLALYPTELVFHSSRQQRVLESIPIERIREVNSCLRGEYFFIILQLEERGELSLKFVNRDIGKEWIGYIMQAMKFNRYVEERRNYSKAESFRLFMGTLINEKTSCNVVTLEDSEQKNISLYGSLPETNSLARSSESIMKLSEFKISAKIGSGSFSVVYLAMRKGRQFALKQLQKKPLLAKEQIKYALGQLSILIRCKGCPYIIPLYFAFQTREYLYLALEFIPTGNLTQLIARRKLTHQQAVVILAELVVAIEFLHYNQIIYRDLKPDNILINPRGHIYLTDFGLAKELSSEHQTAESFLGTPAYLPPERFQEEASGMNYKSDYYGVGCVFFQILHGKSPAAGSNFRSVVYNIQHKQPEIDSSLPPDLVSFLKSTLMKDSSRRIERMSDHQIFKRVDMKAIRKKKHSGMAVDWKHEDNVQIQYQIDEDYTEETYPNMKIAKWSYQCE